MDATWCDNDPFDPFCRRLFHLSYGKRDVVKVLLVYLNLSFLNLLTHCDLVLEFI